MSAVKRIPDASVDTNTSATYERDRSHSLHDFFVGMATGKHVPRKEALMPYAAAYVPRNKEHPPFYIVRTVSKGSQVEIVAWENHDNTFAIEIRWDLLGLEKPSRFARITSGGIEAYGSEKLLPNGGSWMIFDYWERNTERVEYCWALTGMAELAEDLILNCRSTCS